VGKGRAVYLNLSPQRYLMYRQEGTDTDEHRWSFLGEVGLVPWIRVTPLATGRLPKLETVAWSKDGRTLVLILQNASIRTPSSGGAAAEDLVEARIPIRVQLAAPVTGVVNERTGQPLPDGDRFQLELDTTEAVFFSFQGSAAR
jgi:hypothetical protein